MREVTRFGPWSDLLRAVGQTYFMQYARKHLATPTVGDLNFVDTPQGTPSDPQSITFTCAPPHTSAHSRYRSHLHTSTLFTLHRWASTLLRRDHRVITSGAHVALPRESRGDGGAARQ